LARALAWQARGDRFESGILHKKREMFKHEYFPFFICLVFLFLVAPPKDNILNPIVKSLGKWSEEKSAAIGIKDEIL
jgi:hypothetical protein